MISLYGLLEDRKEELITTLLRDYRGGNFTFNKVLSVVAGLAEVIDLQEKIDIERNNE